MSETEEKLSPREKRQRMLEELTNNRQSPAGLVTPQDGIPTSADGEDEKESSRPTGAPGKRSQMIDPQYLLDNPYQSREDYRDIEGLADKMRQFGFKGAISARKHPSRPSYYEIAFGHRRKRAAAIARVLVRVVVEELSDEEMLLLAISENYDREDLTPLEEGKSLLRLSVEFDKSQEEIAVFVGEERKQRITRGYVRNRLRAAKLARDYPSVEQLLREKPDVSLRAIGYLEEEGIAASDVDFIAERLRTDTENEWSADTVGAAVKILKQGGEEAEKLRSSKGQMLLQPQPAAVAALLSNGVVTDPTERIEADPLPLTPQSDAQASAPSPDGATLKRNGILADVVTRFRRYVKTSKNMPLTEEEERALEELGELREQRLGQHA